MNGGLIRRPFKGTFFYEWQVGPIVFQVRHTQHFGRSGARPFPFFHVWRDRAWRFSDLRFQQRFSTREQRPDLGRTDAAAREEV